MVLAILDRERRVVLVEANAKRCAFLHEVAAATGTAVSVIEGRLEDPAVQARLAPCGTVVAPRLRAAGRPARSCFPCASIPYMLYIPEGTALHRSELEAARRRWDFRADIVPSRTAAEARILRLSDVERRRP